jgi:glycosyltransferase involved in cell wall biosynthesis
VRPLAAIWMMNKNRQRSIMTGNKDAPLVSVVMATYNGERFLEAQLESVLNQSYPEIEIIVVDDGSNDSTPEILKKYAGRYSNIKLHFSHANLGYVKNFERGCRLATGAYISFCDQDDVWDYDKTTRLMNHLGDYPMIYCDDELADGALNSLHKKHSDLKKLQPFDNCLYFATDNCVGGHALIMKKEIFVQADPFPVEMPYDLWCAFVATFYGGIQYLDKPLVKWRQHDNNITTSAKTKQIKLAETRKRMQLFYEYCKPAQEKEKHVLKKLLQSYQSYSLYNNILRMCLFFRYRKYLLGMKKRNAFRKFLFCLKMFYKIRLHVA